MQYFERFEEFEKVINKKYPNIKLIVMIQELHQQKVKFLMMLGVGLRLRRLKRIVEEHYYMAI